MEGLWRGSITYLILMTDRRRKAAFAEAERASPELPAWSDALHMALPSHPFDAPRLVGPPFFVQGQITPQQQASMTLMPLPSGGFQGVLHPLPAIPMPIVPHMTLLAEAAAATSAMSDPEMFVMR